MWILFGVSDDTVEKDTFVYFIGVFDNLSLAKDERKKLIVATKSNINNYIIKSVTVNTSYNYDWNNNEEDEVKNI